MAEEESGTAGTAQLRVEHDPERLRYVALLGDRRAGLIAYAESGSTVEMYHTEVDPALQGRGIGRVLVGEALADVARRGLRVEPRCPFVAAYLDEHPELAALLAR